LNEISGTKPSDRPAPSLVLFDLDDTLCDHEASLRVRLRQAFTVAFNGDPPDNLPEIIEQSIEYSVFGTDHFADILRPHGVARKDWIEAAIDSYVSDRFLGLELFEEAVDVVESLRQRVQIGMITNGPSDIQRGKIERLGIGDLFPFILVSEEQGIWKPDPRIFERAMELGEADPDDTIYLGDNPEHDVGGAHAAGITSVWVNRFSRQWPGGPEPHYVIDDLRRLFDLFHFPAPDV
jgi:FMN hydrolase / 5-amino-6-(5-phospho-D-ribitylamino)uracil phosphatase